MRGSGGDDGDGDDDDDGGGSGGGGDEDNAGRLSRTRSRWWLLTLTTQYRNVFFDVIR